MTLTTKVVVHEDTDWPALHAWVNENLVRPADWPADKPVALYERASDDARDGMHNVIGQGLDSLFWTHFTGKPLVWADPDDDEDMVEYYKDFPSGSGYLSFDNPYGGNVRGMSAWTLHAYFIHRLAREYFEPNGLTFSWQDESSGEWFEGLNGFDKLFASGDAASLWFEETVKPVIRNEIGVTLGE